MKTFPKSHCLMLFVFGERMVDPSPEQEAENYLSPIRLSTVYDHVN
jgi:hypothetical protein